MWQWLLIVPVVLASAIYAAWRLMPSLTRLRLASWVSRSTAGGPLERWGEALHRAAQPSGSCDACPATRLGQARKR